MNYLAYDSLSLAFVGQDEEEESANISSGLPLSPLARLGKSQAFCEHLFSPSSRVCGFFWRTL